MSIQIENNNLTEHGRKVFDEELIALEKRISETELSLQLMKYQLALYYNSYAKCKHEFDYAGSIYLVATCKRCGYQAVE